MPEGGPDTGTLPGEGEAMDAWWDNRELAVIITSTSLDNGPTISTA